MKPKFKIFLIFIFILAFVLRVWQVGEIPTFISDEASIGYNGYSVLKTGRDEWGKLMPLSFKSFGEYKLPLYIYSVVPSVAIFGLNEFAVRFPSVLFGTLTVLLVFFLTKEILSQRQKQIANYSGEARSCYAGHLPIPFLASFLLAISPWHIQVSRMALEANLGLFLTVLAALFLLKAKKNAKFYCVSNKLVYYFSSLLFALTFYTYNSCRVFTPLFLLAYFYITRKEIIFRNIAKPLILFLLLILPLVFSGFAGSRERFYKVGIFQDPGIIAQINQQRGECQMKTSVAFCFFRYNKPVVYSQVFIKNYFSHFSYRFLFTQGAGLSQYGVPGQGVVYLWELPFLILGLIYLFKFKKIFLTLLAWLLIAPLANSLTGATHPVRAIFMLPILPIFSAVGVIISISFFSKRIYFRYLYTFLLVLVISTSLVAFGIRYFVLYPVVTDWNWQMGYKGLYQELTKLESQVDKIYVSKFYGEPHIFYLFYQKFDPHKYQTGEEIVRYDREDRWVNVDRIGKYFFVQEPREIYLNPGEILAEPLQEFSFENKILTTIKYRNGQTAFLILVK